MILRRRDFLKAVAVSVGALVVGCGSDDDNNNANSVNNTNTCTTGELESGTQFFPQSIASGDPSASTVVVWTRLEDGDADGILELQVALDGDFQDLFKLDGESCGMMLTAAAGFDHCVKARLQNLSPSTYYYYRFIYEKDGTRYTTNVGRTKTAPADDSDTPAKFAFTSCQDFNGKYFNAYKHMVEQDDLDFFVHLGDYVYETTGDPQFQETTPDRIVTFRDEAGAIAFNEGTEDAFFAAKSISNYRDLYRIYRSDAWLQRAHELFPCVAIWDDHEFSDDCFGATATYFDGAEDETDVPRRKSANQAWFEYMPVDYLDAPDFQYDANAEYGDDIRIYRDVRYGKNLHLVMTDLRSYRADHVIPEDLFPGTVLADQATVESELGELPAWADPYLDIDTFDGGSFATVLKENAEALEINPDDVGGNTSATYINGVSETLNESRPANMQLPQIDTAALDRGLTALSMGKTGGIGSLGSRYFVVKEPFNLYAKLRFAESTGASENTLGTDQQTWFLDTMNGSDAVWKVWGNEFTLTQRMVDLTALAATVGPAFAQKFLLSAEDWDGQPNKRNELLEALSGLDNVVAITGDIHAFFAGTPFVDGDSSKRIVEFVTGAISSSSMKRLLINTANSDPALKAAGAAALAAGIESFLFGASKPNPSLAFANTDHQGYTVLECTADTMSCTMYQIPESNVGKDIDQPEVGGLMDVTKFEVRAGDNNLYDEDGKRWDPDNAAWA